MRKKLSAQSNPSPAKSTAQVKTCPCGGGVLVPLPNKAEYGCNTCPLMISAALYMFLPAPTGVAAMATNTPCYCAYCGKPIGASFTSTGGQFWCGQGCYTGYQNIQQFDWTADEEVLPAYDPGPPRCSYCDRELSETLDRPALKSDREDHCRDCRSKLQIAPF